MEGPATVVRPVDIYTGTSITPSKPINAYPSWYKDGSDISSSSSPTKVITRAIEAGLNYVSHSTAGNQANYKIPYARITRKFSDRFKDSINVGQILVTKRNTKNHARNKCRYTTMNLPMFNYYIASIQGTPKTPK